MSKRERADRLLVARGVFESRARAQAAIEAGRVIADGRPIRKSSEEISTAAAIAAEPAYPYVSRGDTKLAAALDNLSLDGTDLPRRRCIHRRFYRGSAGARRTACLCGGCRPLTIARAFASA